MNIGWPRCATRRPFRLGRFNPYSGNLESILSIDVKICGIRTQAALQAAVEAGARAIGFVFYAPSPRAVAFDIAAGLSRLLPTTTRAVGLFVDASDDAIAAAVAQVPLNILQLHGDETPRRVAQIRDRFSIPVMKAIRVATAQDLRSLSDYEAVSDWILFDAKPPSNVTAMPGGTGIAFDWQLLQKVKIARPWMLSGGLNADNLAEAVTLTGAKAVDVSSGVEDRPGVKSIERIRAFIAAAKRL